MQLRSTAKSNVGPLNMDPEKIDRFHRWDIENDMFSHHLRTGITHLDAYIIWRNLQHVSSVEARLAYTHSLNT